MNLKDVCGYDDATGEDYGHEWLPAAPVEDLDGMYSECSDCGLLEAR